MYNETYKKALENRVSRLAAECLLAITDEQEKKLRNEMMKSVNELNEKFGSVYIVYADKNVHKVVELGYEERWNKGINAIYAEIEKLCNGVTEENRMEIFKKIYKIIDLMHDLVDRRI